MQLVLVERNQSVATIRLNRPEQGNAIDLPLALALEEAVINVSADPAVRCVILTGNGRLFCVGGDVPAFAAAGDQRGAFLAELAGALHRSVKILSKMQKTLIVAVNGPAAGAGMSLAILGDLVLCDNSAHFTAAYSGVGLTPDGGMSWTLPKLVGVRKAQEMLLANKRVSAEEAASIGLVTRVVASDTLEAEASALAAKIAAGPVRALSVARSMILSGATTELDAHLDLEAQGISEAAAGPEGAEGVAAFNEKRRPNFTDIN